MRSVFWSSTLLHARSSRPEMWVTSFLALRLQKRWKSAIRSPMCSVRAIRPSMVLKSWTLWSSQAFIRLRRKILKICGHLLRSCSSTTLRSHFSQNRRLLSVSVSVAVSSDSFTWRSYRSVSDASSTWMSSLRCPMCRIRFTTRRVIAPKCTIHRGFLRLPLSTISRNRISGLPS